MSFQMNIENEKRYQRSLGGPSYFEPEEPSSKPRYFLYSVMVHIALGLSAMLVEITTPPPSEPVEITIEEIKPEIQKQIVKAPPKEAPVKLAKVPPIPVPKNLPKAISNQPRPTQGAPVVPSMGDGPKTVIAKPAPVSLDDIETPDVDNLMKQVAAKPSARDFDDSDLSNDFSKINNASRSAAKMESDNLNSAANEMDRQTEAGLRELDENASEKAKAFGRYKAGLAQANQQQLAAARAREAAEAAAMAAAQKDLAAAAAENERRGRAARLAAAQAAEEKAQAAARGAAEKIRAQALLRNGNGGNGNGFGEGSGQGNLGDPNQTAIAGIPQGIRSLDQLRQMPGNIKPEYSAPERLAGHKGKVSFAAYINKDGTTANFKLLTSTGFRNLDAKTLAALKKWKFYPGQEGWVELPFEWDLRGGVQQAGGLLRRSAHR